MSTPSPRLAAALASTEARQLYDILMARYGVALSSAQIARLRRRRKDQPITSALNLLLGQLAVHGVQVQPDLLAAAASVCDGWAALHTTRRAA